MAASATLASYVPEWALTSVSAPWFGSNFFRKVNALAGLLQGLFLGGRPRAVVRELIHTNKDDFGVNPLSENNLSNLDTNIEITRKSLVLIYFM